MENLIVYIYIFTLRRARGVAHTDYESGTPDKVGGQIYESRGGSSCKGTEGLL